MALHVDELDILFGEAMLLVLEGEHIAQLLCLFLLLPLLKQAKLEKEQKQATADTVQKAGTTFPCLGRSVAAEKVHDEHGDDGEDDDTAVLDGEAAVLIARLDLSGKKEPHKDQHHPAENKSQQERQQFAVRLNQLNQHPIQVIHTVLHCVCSCRKKSICRHVREKQNTISALTSTNSRMNVKFSQPTIRRSYPIQYGRER